MTPSLRRKTAAVNSAAQQTPTALPVSGGSQLNAKASSARGELADHGSTWASCKSAHSLGAADGTSIRQRAGEGRGLDSAMTRPEVDRPGRRCAGSIESSFAQQVTPSAASELRRTEALAPFWPGETRQRMAALILLANDGIDLAELPDTTDGRTSHCETVEE